MGSTMQAYNWNFEIRVGVTVSDITAAVASVIA